MALFSSSQKPPLPDNLPQLRCGMKTSVLTPTGDALFTGQLQMPARGILEVRATPRKVAAQAKRGQEMRLRVYQWDGSYAPLRAFVAHTAPEFWWFEKARFLQTKERRGFFRQPFVLNTTLYSSTSGVQLSCRILDISASGLRMVTTWKFQAGSLFRIELSLLPGVAPFSFSCEVVRGRRLTRGGSPTQQYEYGCHFTGMSPGEQERLLQAILSLQRKAITR